MLQDSWRLGAKQLRSTDDLQGCAEAPTVHDLMLVAAVVIIERAGVLVPM
jgi:hypothetical protein